MVCQAPCNLIDSKAIFKFTMSQLFLRIKKTCFHMISGNLHKGERMNAPMEMY
jgi:hypothetical protein